MRDDQVALVQPLVAEQQDVHIYAPRPPSPGGLTPALGLDLLGGFQELARRSGPIDRDYLVQKAGLLDDPPGLGLDDATLTQDARSFLTQPPPRGAKVAGSRTAVGAKSKIGDRHLDRLARRR